MKLTSAERIKRSQLISGVLRTVEVWEVQLTSRASAWRRSVVGHQVLTAVVFLAGGAAIISPLLQVMLSDWAATRFGGFGIRVPIFAAGLVVWISVTYLVAMRVPIRCRHCGGRAYWRSQRPIRYDCRACGKSTP